MGLFAPDRSEDLAQLKAFSSIFLNRWNSWYAPAGKHEAVFDDEASIPFLEAAEKVMNDVFPEKPSAFKRLGTLAVLIQHYPVFRLLDSFQKPSEKEYDCQWMPRIGLTATQIFASETSVILPDGEKKLTWFRMPSPHFQLEFISVLRNYRLAAHQNDSFALDVLCERALNTSLILEGCYYLHEIQRSGGIMEGIVGNVDGCLKDLDPVHSMDKSFHEVAMSYIKLTH